MFVGLPGSGKTISVVEYLKYGGGVKIYTNHSFEAFKCVLTLHFCLGAFSYVAVVFFYPATEYWFTRKR